MYINAIIKDKVNNREFTVKVKRECDIIVPNGKIEQMRYFLSTTSLLFDFYRKMKPYANQNHAIVEIKTDNPIIAEKLRENGQKVIFEPILEENVNVEA